MNSAFLFSDDGVLYTVGSNTFNQLGYQREDDSLMPQKVLALEDKCITSVGCGDTFSVAVTDGNEALLSISVTALSLYWYLLLLSYEHMNLNWSVLRWFAISCCIKPVLVFTVTIL